MIFKFCFWCASTKNLTREHIIPVGLGGGFDRNNTRRACHKCNAERGRVTDAVRHGNLGRLDPALWRKWVEAEKALLAFSPHERFAEKAVLL